MWRPKLKLMKMSKGIFRYCWWKENESSNFSEEKMYVLSDCKEKMKTLCDM